MTIQHTHTLHYTTVASVGFDGAAKYANVDSPFCAHAYADLAGISVNEIDADSIKAANDAASHEGPEAWILVSHTTQEM